MRLPPTIARSCIVPSTVGGEHARDERRDTVRLSGSYPAKEK